MKNIGLFGGPTVAELGPAADVQLFFDCIASFVVPAVADRDWPLVTDRLYRRYVRREDLEPTQELINEVQNRFGAVASSAVDWTEIAGPNAVTRLDPAKPTLAAVFAAYFERFADCRGSAQIYFQTWQQYRPVKIGITDLPDAITEKNRPLAEYDSLEGEPFWKRA
jgi:hypothetical protein